MRCSSLIALLAALMVPGCFIVTDDPDDDDNGGETGNASSADGSEPESADETGVTPVCGDPETNSVEDANGECSCEATFIWCTEDPDDITCCPGACGDPGTNSTVVDDGSCECLSGFDWCTDNEMDVSCCAV